MFIGKLSSLLIEAVVLILAETVAIVFVASTGSTSLIKELLWLLLGTSTLIILQLVSDLCLIIPCLDLHRAPQGQATPPTLEARDAFQKVSLCFLRAWSYKPSRDFNLLKHKWIGQIIWGVALTEAMDISSVGKLLLSKTCCWLSS